MKLITAHKSFTGRYEGTHEFQMREGWKIITPDHLMAVFGGAPISVENLTQEKNIFHPIDFTGKRLLVSRTGGLGDMFFIMRIIKEIKSRYDKVYVDFHTSPKYTQAVKNLFGGWLLDEVGTIVIPYTTYEKANHLVTFEGLIEANPDGNRVNAFTLMSQKFQIDIDGNHTVPFKIPKQYQEQADKIASEWNRPVIGLQIRATAILRTYPLTEQAKLIKILGESGFKVLLLDEFANIVDAMNTAFSPDIHPYIIPPFREPDISPSFELACALAGKCKLIVAPDSIFIYVGAGQGVPVIGLYGPFSSRLRVQGLKVYALEVRGGCMNCASHQNAPCRWTRSFWSPCLARIKAEYIALTIEDILKGAK